MSILSKKESVFGKLDSMKTIIGLPKLDGVNSFSSVNNSGSSNDFLLNLLSSLVGIEELKHTIIDIITSSIPQFELTMKSSIKDELKSIALCGSNPTIPTWAQQGFIIPVNKIDPFGLLKVNPDSIPGYLLYNDIQNGLNSTDFNTYLYYTIQETPNQTQFYDLLNITFSQSPIPPVNSNNVFNISINQQYQNSDIIKFNIDYLDKISLFDNHDILIKAIDQLFGSITSNLNLNKSLQQVELESQVNDIITCIIENDNITTISDTYFTFSNDDLYEIQTSAINRYNGVRKFITCDTTNARIPIKNLTKFKQQILTATSITESYDIVESTVVELSQIASNQTSEGSDKISVQVEFLQLLYKVILNSMMMGMMSPKLQILFMINYKMIYGVTESYDGPIDFIKKNKKMFLNVVNSMVNQFMNIILNKVMKLITSLAVKNASVLLKESSNNRMASLLSLQGVPQEVIAMIRQNVPVSL